MPTVSASMRRPNCRRQARQRSNLRARGGVGGVACVCGWCGGIKELPAAQPTPQFGEVTHAHPPPEALSLTLASSQAGAAEGQGDQPRGGGLPPEPPQAQARIRATAKPPVRPARRLGQSFAGDHRDDREKFSTPNGLRFTPLAGGSPKRASCGQPHRPPSRATQRRQRNAAVHPQAAHSGARSSADLRL